MADDAREGLEEEESEAVGGDDHAELELYVGGVDVDVVEVVSDEVGGEEGCTYDDCVEE